MRRPAPALPISPRLIKHFAAITVALTVCIAIVADGSTTDAVAQKIATNSLKAKQASTPGTNRALGAPMIVKSRVSGNGGDDSLDFADNGGGGISPGPVTLTPVADGLYTPGSTITTKPPPIRIKGETVTYNAVPRDALPRTPGAKPGLGQDPRSNQAPAQNQLENLLEASRQRSQPLRPELN